MKHELRQGKHTHRRWVVISPKRQKRPHGAKKGDVCAFCPGNERLTPPEIYRVEENGKWLVRVFPNKFPAFSLKYSKAYGLQYVIVDSPEHITEFYKLSKDNIARVLETYIVMMDKMLKTKGIRNVLVFKNEGKAAGMIIDHNHSQMIGTKKAFPYLEEELDICEDYFKKKKRCLFCDLIKTERKSSKRFICENKGFIAVTPYVPLHPHSIMILPKRHSPDFTSITLEEIDEFADILKKVLTALGTLKLAYNFYIRTSKKKYHHFYLEIRSRPNVYAGFELGSGLIINAVPPEDSAKYLRSKI